MRRANLKVADGRQWLLDCIHSCVRSHLSIETVPLVGIPDEETTEAHPPNRYSCTYSFPDQCLIGWPSNVGFTRLLLGFSSESILLLGRWSIAVLTFQLYSFPTCFAKVLVNLPFQPKGLSSNDQSSVTLFSTSGDRAGCQY